MISIRSPHREIGYLSSIGKEQYIYYLFIIEDDILLVRHKCTTRGLQNIHSNEIADALAKAGADDASVPSAPLTYLELFSRAKSRDKKLAHSTCASLVSRFSTRWLSIN
ncbi:hypothetical protein AVEN_274864-1 [Araneus ventricosus]|uniref:RNase H type-1 domain-containing protein n=1 Tax=Araneus ventricosus TaxID=182803 RepID=A0A4Y2MIP4_ARAVE|nr:hypothetical protein AVEN_274864-1 [Araneus ventricosus]